RFQIHEYAGMATTNPLDATTTNGAEGTTAVNTVTTGSVPTTVTAPVANGSHVLTALARDAAGNQTTSEPVSVTVSNDSTPPAIADVSALSITSSSATISWTTDEPSTSQVDYGVTTAYGSTTALNTTLDTTHSMTMSGLAEGTLYHVRVRSIDASGNLALSGDVAFTTLDVTAPTVSVTAPAGGAVVSGTTAVTATARDNV